MNADWIVQARNSAMTESGQRRMRPGIRGNGIQKVRGSRAYNLVRIFNGQQPYRMQHGMSLPGQRHARLQAETWLGKDG